ncbi:MAG: hypothetical protein LBC81_00175 [Tannerellaceae bacterium]|jgi:hypothetical protein|nr:hypothetical protein [Tannerellaceae bacterium]
MKANVYIIAATIAALAVSCLGEGGDRIKIGNYPGVAARHGDSTFIYLKGREKVYAASGANSLNPDDCLLIDFMLDYSRPENADSGRIKGFLTIELQKAVPVERHTLLNAATDTSQALPAERTLLSVLAQHAFIRNKFFLFTTHPTDSLPLQFNLYCDPASPKTNGAYDLYLRIIPRSDGAVASEPATIVNAFAMDMLSSREPDSLFFRIHYPTRINAGISWGTTGEFRFPVGN